MVPSGLFLVLLAVGMVFDVHSRRVPNALVVVMLGWAAVSAGMHWSTAASFGSAALGLVAGLALWLPFWLLGLLGAGDVKYFAAGAAWVGPDLAWRAALLTTLLGGLIAVVVLVRQRGLHRTAAEVALQYRHAAQLIAHADVSETDAAQRTFPYAVPMGLALAVAALRPEALRQW